MIQPINQNLNIASANNLTPVEIPHFTGKSKAVKTKADSFVKQSKVQNTVKKAKTSAKEVELKKNAAEIAGAATKGAKEGIYVVADVAKKSVEFTGAFLKSVFDDSKNIIREKGYKTISAIDSLV